MAEPVDDVGVVIVTYNSAAHVLEALEALPLGRLRVVVVDHASSDGTADLVAARGLPGVTVLRRPNEGFGAGCNAGLEALPDAHRVLFLNPDAVVLEKDLLRLLRHLDAEPRAGLVAPRLRNGEIALSSAGALATAVTELRFALPPRLGRLIPDRRFPASFDVSGAVGVVEGACMLADAAALRELGGFDERFFLFFEEHDLARRLASRGREVHLCAEAFAQHAVGASREAVPTAGLDSYWRSALLYLRKWGGGGGPAVVRAALRLGLLWEVTRGRRSRADMRRILDALPAGSHVRRQVSG